jgi:hypothetical protein
MGRAAQKTKPVTPERAVREESSIRVGLPQHGLQRGAYWGNQAALRRLTRTAPHLQRRLEVGAVNDPLEAEADRAADDVMPMPNPLASVHSVPPLVSRKCDNCEDEKLHAKPNGARTQGGHAPAIVHQVLESTGQPLDPATRDFKEPRFGHSFEQVRVHEDARAVESAEAVQAKAYAVGGHVVFGRGQFRENTSEGRSLLAHELTHVVQQDGGTQIIRRAPDKDEEEKKRKLANRKMAGKKAAPYQYPPMLNPPIDLTASVYQGLRA